MNSLQGELCLRKSEDIFTVELTVEGDYQVVPGSYEKEGNDISGRTSERIVEV